MHGDRAHDQRDAGDLGRGRPLPQDDEADRRGAGRDQGEREDDGGAGQPGHRQPVTDVGCFARRNTSLALAFTPVSTGRRPGESVVGGTMPRSLQTEWIVGEAAPAERHGEDPDDAALVAAAQADRRAFAPVYARYVDAVFRYCYHRLGDRVEAEDATSLVFTKALAALPRYRDDAFRAWLFAIAHNVVADGFRRARPVEPLAAAADLPERSDGPEDLVVAEHERRALHVLLRRLPDEQRRVMELRLSGLTSPEVARVLGRSPTAVRSLQFRAVARLRELLAAEAGGEEGRDGRR